MIPIDPTFWNLVISFLNPYWELIYPYIEWIGMGFGLLGALFIWRPTNESKVVAYELWSYSNTAWIIVGFVIWKPALIILNVAYLISNILGIYFHINMEEENFMDELLALPPKE